MRRLSSLALVPAICAALLLTSCSTPPPEDFSSPTSTPIPAIPTSLPTIAQRTASVAGAPVTIAVRELRVTDAVMTLTWSATVISGDEWAPLRSFAGRYDDQATTSRNWYTTSGVNVIDTTHAQRYLPALTAQGHCMCSSTPMHFSIRVGQTAYFSAVYQAVPEDVTHVSVDIPHSGTFTDIPVLR